MHYGESKRATDQNSPSNGTQFVCYRYDVARTYEGFDFRTPSELCNEMMLKVVSQAPDRYFGKWPLHIIQPYARRQRWTTGQFVSRPGSSHRQFARTCTYRPWCRSG